MVPGVWVLSAGGPVARASLPDRVGHVRFDEFVDAVRQLGGFWAVLNEPPPDLSE